MRSSSPTNADAAKKMLMAFAPPAKMLPWLPGRGDFEERPPGTYAVRRDSWSECCGRASNGGCRRMDWQRKAADFFAGSYHTFFRPGDAALYRVWQALPALNAAVLASASHAALQEWGITMTEEELDPPVFFSWPLGQ